ncbi:MAG TPA: sugar phosphate nucleotidyltransferase [Gammaproteobacteria bacterium]|nr:sugar phosphate nucleotidyltransferase [Gammaproteobacteria bacterium]
MIVPVILCGGSGTRLWPLSTPEMPKQFLSLVSERSLFQETLLRLDGLAGLGNPIVVCNALHRGLVADQLAEIGAKARAIVLEPAGRNTAPAIGVAAGIASIGPVAGSGSAGSGSDPGGSDPGPVPGPVLLVLPADHVIADAEAFRAAVRHAVRAAGAGKLVTFGIVPTRPETGYGYIEQRADEGGWSIVTRFVEKPDLKTAREYLESGRFLWNSGMFVFGADMYLDELARYAPAIHAASEKAVAGMRKNGDVYELGSEFLASPSDSIDYAVMEKTERAAVVPLDAGWNDVGSWEALHDVLEKNADGNVLRGDIIALDAGNNFVIAASRKVALLGLDNVIVIESENELLIMKKDRSQDLKRLLEILAEKSR